MEIERLCCAQLENVSMLGVGQGHSKMYFAHVQQFVSFLKGGIERQAASRLLNTFLNSVDGQALKGSHGGDLVSAIERGSLNKMMYSYLRRGGSPSQFVSIDGMKTLVNGISGVEEHIKTRLKQLCEGHDHFSYSKLTPEQVSNDDEEEVVEELFDNSGLQDIAFTDGVASISERMWFEARLALYRSIAAKRIVEEQMKAKDAGKQIVEEQLKVKDAEIAKEQIKNEKMQEQMNSNSELFKERAEKEILQQKLALIEESHAKDLEITRLKMKLEFEHQKNVPSPASTGNNSGVGPNRKRASTSQLDTEEDEQEEEHNDPHPSVLRTARVNADKTAIPGGGHPQIHWLVAYEGDVELTFANLEPELRVLSKIESTRHDNCWFSLLSMQKRIRITPIARAMNAMGLGGSIWIEAFRGCTTWVRMDVPSSDLQSAAGARILAYMAKKQWSRDGAAPGFPMVVVK